MTLLLTGKLKEVLKSKNLITHLLHTLLFVCREEIKKTQAAKLRCIIHYFDRLGLDWPSVGGRVFYSRQVFTKRLVCDRENCVFCCELLHLFCVNPSSYNENRLKLLFPNVIEALVQTWSWALERQKRFQANDFI